MKKRKEHFKGLAKRCRSVVILSPRSHFTNIDGNFVRRIIMGKECVGSIWFDENELCLPEPKIHLEYSKEPIFTILFIDHITKICKSIGKILKVKYVEICTLNFLLADYGKEDFENTGWEVHDTYSRLYIEP